MRKIISLMVALFLFGGLVRPALASESLFVLSVSYKDGPEIETAEAGGKEVSGYLVVTTILKAREKTTDIQQEDREALLEIYEKLKNGTMKLPLEGDYVIRELVDIRWRNTGESGQNREQWLAEEGNTIAVTFDLGFTKITDVVVMVYRNGLWERSESKVDPSDGTVTVELEDACPVAFCVREGQQTERPGTGDPAFEKLPAYTVAMAISGVALMVLLIWRRKKRK